jgi:hypothetical protein
MQRQRRERVLFIGTQFSNLYTLMEATKQAGALDLQGGHEKRSASHLAIHN